MKLKGNYNLGVYNPPSALEIVTYSEQASTELALKLNNLKAGQETGFKQNITTSWPKILNPNIDDLITSLNNFDIEIFIHMLREGWRETKEEIPPPSTPVRDNKMPKGWEPTVPNLPAFDIEAGLYYVRTTAVSADGRYWYDDGNGTTSYSVTPPQTGKLREPNIWPPNEPTVCTKVTQQNIESSYQSGGGVFYRSAGIDSAYPMANLINRIEASSPSRYMPPIGLIAFEKRTYYRRIRIIKEAYGGAYKPGMIVDNPVHMAPFFNSSEEGNYWEWMEWELIFQSTIELIKCGTPPPSPIYKGRGVPPPSTRRRRMCCSCNDVATIVENQGILQIRAQEKLIENLKDHIDRRALEIIAKDLEHLKALDFEELLKVILKRVNETEANLWNGISQ